MVFDPEGAGNRALKEPYPIDAADYDYDNWTARIGATTVDDRSAQGVVTGGNRSARWDLRITPGAEEPVKLLTERAYDGAIPDGQDDGAPSAGAVRRPARTRRRSASWSTAGPAASTTTGAPGTPRPTRSARCAASTTRQNRAWRSSRRAQQIGPYLAAGGHAVRLPPRRGEFAVRSIRGSLHTQGRYRPFSWTFGARVGERMIEGEIFTEPADVIGLTYTDTDGGSKYCYNSAIATCRIQLAGKAFERTELVATRRAMFEILTDTRHDAVPLLA